MVRIREDDINAIRNKAGIVDIISRYLPVYRKGKSLIFPWGPRDFPVGPT